MDDDRHSIRVGRNEVEQALVSSLDELEQCQSPSTVSLHFDQVLPLDQSQLMVNTSTLESEGLMYAHLEKQKLKHLNYSPSPPPESALDVLTSENVTLDISTKEEIDSDMVLLCHQDDRMENPSPDHQRSSLQYGPIDPNILLDLEKHSQELGLRLEQMLGGLETNLMAMSVCSHQAISLHKESTEALQSTVDNSVKAMYSFLSRFNELSDNMKPIKELSTQINEVNEILRNLEKLI